MKTSQLLHETLQVFAGLEACNKLSQQIRRANLVQYIGKGTWYNLKTFIGGSSGNIDKTDFCEQEFLPQDASSHIEVNAAKIHVYISYFIRNTQWEITPFLLQACVFTSVFALRLGCTTAKMSRPILNITELSFLCHTVLEFKP
jgi:hypothetical protein